MKNRLLVEYEGRADEETGMAGTADHPTGEDNIVSTVVDLTGKHFYSAVLAIQPKRTIPRAKDC